MKRITIPFITLIIVTSIHCKKATTSFHSYLNFKMDGASIECQWYIRVSPSTLPGYLLITGYWNDNGIEIEANHGNNTITVGSYPFDMGTLRQGTVYMGTQSSPTGPVYYAGGAGSFDPLVVGSGQLNITEINTDHVKGNFAFVAVTNITGLKKMITDGDFDIKRDY